MITKICLNNFMAHIDTVIELGPGLNVIIGPNNCGKSAIVAALETVCYNKAGQKQNRDYAISHGSKEASVTVETSEGHVLVWNKKKGSGGDWYKINGREVHRVRGKYPDDLHDYLRLPIVLINNGKDEVPIHFAHQKDPIFLIDQPPQRAAEFFAASSDVARLLEMRKLHQSRTRERKREQNRLKKDLAEIDERLQRLAPLSEIDGKIKEAATEHQVIEKAEQSLKQARRTVEQVQRRTREVDEFVQYYDALKSLKALPKLAETEALQQVIRRQKRLEKSIRFGGWQAEAYTPLSSPPELEPTKSLSKLLKSMQRLERENQTEGLRNTVLGEITPPPQLEETKSLGKLIREFESHAKQQKTLEKKSRDIGEQIDRVQSEWAALAAQEPRCPTCGSVFTKESLTQVHQHDGGTG